jgi:two-component sensor histidine kinase/streptogramin lyase
VLRKGSETQTCALLQNGVLYNGGWQNGIDRMRFDPLEQYGTQWRPIPEVIPTPDEVTGMVALSDGSILAGTRASGLMRYDPANGSTTFIKRRRSDPSSLPSDRIRCVYADPTGAIWIGTANGLAYHVPSVWSMNVQRIFSAQDDEQPELFFHRIEAMGDHGVRAFSSMGFYTQDSVGALVVHHPVIRNGMELQPTVMGRDFQGNDLLGCEYGLISGDVVGKGPITDLVVRDGRTRYAPGAMFQVRSLDRDTFQGRPVHVIGTMGYGLVVVDASSGDMLGYGMSNAAISVKARALITSVARTPDGHYWIASGDGLYDWSTDKPLQSLFGGNRMPVSNEGILLPGTAVMQLEAHGDTVWGVTRDALLFRSVNGRLTSFKAPWPVGSMNGLEAERNGRFWITTDDGLLRFDPRDSSFIRVPVNEGREFRKLNRAITSLPDGRIALAANNALLSFDPVVYDSLPPLSLPLLNGVSMAGDSVVVTKDVIELSYRATALDISVSALAIGLPHPLIFEYRLAGVEDQWRSTDARTPIRYAGIPIGEHQLRVRTIDPFGRTSPERTILTITVIGPVWQQWWFYVLALLLAAGAFYALYRYRLAQAMKLQIVRNRIASDLHDEVGSSLSSITIGSRLAAQLSTKGDAQVREILARIGETSSESLRSMSDIVWAIDPKNDQGEALVKRMRRIASELLESKGIDVAFDVGNGVEELRLPMNARKEIVLLYKEAVHNTSKYSGATSVHVSLHRHDGRLMLSVKDDGRGFDPALHPDGHGLGSMQRRAASLDASYELKSSPGQGTGVSLVVDLTRIRD